MFAILSLCIEMVITAQKSSSSKSVFCLWQYDQPNKLIKMVLRGCHYGEKNFFPKNKTCAIVYVVPSKGDFVIHSTDLNKDIFRDLFKLSEEEFGLPRDDGSDHIAMWFYVRELRNRDHWTRCNNSLRRESLICLSRSHSPFSFN